MIRRSFDKTGANLSNGHFVKRGRIRIKTLPDGSEVGGYLVVDNTGKLVKSPGMFGVTRIVRYNEDEKVIELL